MEAGGVHPIMSDCADAACEVIMRSGQWSTKESKEDWTEDWTSEVEADCAFLSPSATLFLTRQ